MKKLLLLGGSRYLLPVIREAKALGCHVITCDYLPDNPAHKFADEYHNVSITDMDAVLRLAKELQIDGVMSFACDPGVVTAAYVAEALGLPSCGSFRAVSILQDKAKFRRFLEENGFTVPRSKGYTELSAALADVDTFPFPVIVKPVDSAGSKGVTRVDDPARLPAAVDCALSFSRAREFIIEAFIEPMGYTSDTECFSVDGELTFASFNCQHFDPQADNPYTPAGYTWPSSMTPAHQAELRSELQRLITLLDLKSSVYNVETREGLDGKAYIMEFSPRGGGNRLCEMLEYCCGTNLIRNAVKAALGEPVEALRDPTYTGHWAEVILHSDKAGRYAGLALDAAVRPYVVEEDLWVQPGEPVEAFSGANKAIGTLVLNFPTAEEREKRMADIPGWLKILVEE